MSDLPRFVQRAPTFLYAAGVVYLVLSVLLNYFQLADAYRGITGSPTFDRMDTAYRLTLLSTWLQAAEGAIYFFAYGVITQILLAIWRNGGKSDGGASE
jgi:hypothetical protein